MEDCLISIIVPTYNSSKYIEECLVSLHKQEYSALQIIVVDDGSDDNTLEICEKFSNSDKRIQILSKSHSGVSAARNLGIDHSKGNFIGFVDSDDFIEYNFIDKYIDAIAYFDEKKMDYAWIMCGMQVDVYCGTMDDESKVYEDEEEFLLLPRTDIAKLSWLKLFNFVTNKLYIANVLCNKNIRFKEDICIAEDLQFNIDYLYAIGGSFGMINRPLYHYVRRSNCSQSLIYYPNAEEDTKRIYNNLLTLVSELNGVTEDDICVIQSFYIMDWTSRLTALYYDKVQGITHKTKMEIIRNTMMSEEYQNTLDKVYKMNKISMMRFLLLKSKKFSIYCLLRRIYRLIK